MKILVKYNGDVFAYGSYMGKHFWYVHEGNTPRWKRSKGVIVPTMMWEEIGLASLEQGFTKEDFRKVQTVAPSDRKESFFESRNKSTRSVRVAKEPSNKTPKEKKVAVRKTSLHNSIKLF